MKFLSPAERKEKRKKTSYRVIENLKVSMWIASRNVISNAGAYGRVSLGCLNLYHVTTDRFIFPDLHTVRSLLKLGIVVIFIHDSDINIKCGTIEWWIALIHGHDIKCVTRQQKENKKTLILKPHTPADVSEVMRS